MITCEYVLYNSFMNRILCAHAGDITTINGYIWNNEVCVFVHKTLLSSLKLVENPEVSIYTPYPKIFFCISCFPYYCLKQSLLKEDRVCFGCIWGYSLSWWGRDGNWWWESEATGHSSCSQEAERKRCLSACSLLSFSLRNHSHSPWNSAVRGLPTR